MRAWQVDTLNCLSFVDPPAILTRESCIKMCNLRERRSVEIHTCCQPCKCTFAFRQTVHDVHTNTAALSPLVPDPLQYLFLSSVSDTDVRTPRVWLKKNDPRPVVTQSRNISSCF